MDTDSLQAFESGHAQPSIAHAHCEDDRVGGHARTVGPYRVEALAIVRQRRHGACTDEIRAEDPCLLVGALSQLRAAEATREAQIVPDSRTTPRLSTDGFAFDDQCMQSL